MKTIKRIMAALICIDDSTYGDSNQCKSGRFQWKYVNRDGDK